MTGKPKRISLCMIVKNEEEHLARCLESVRREVDEIIIVDTGSTDATIEIAERFETKIIRYPWEEDFAAARNRGLEEAEGQWILFMDADEELEVAEAGQLREIVRHERYEGFFLQVHNHLTDDKRKAAATINPIIRLFRNRPEHRFTGKIHEQIAASIVAHNPKAAFHITDIKLHHYGYSQEAMVKKDKVARNLGMLLESLKEHADDPFHHYNMAVEYMRAQDHRTALHHLRTAQKLIIPETSYAHLLYKYEARCLFALSELEEAISCCDRGLSLYPDYTDLHHTKGVALLTLGKPAEAEEAAAKAVRLGAAASHYHTETGIGTFTSTFLLAQIHEQLGRFETAIHGYAETVRLAPDMNEPLFRIFRIYKVTDRQQEIPALFQQTFAIRSADALWKVIDALIEEGCYLAASLMLADAAEPYASTDEYEPRGKYALLCRGHLPDEMQHKLDAVMETKPHYDKLQQWIRRISSAGSEGAFDLAGIGQAVAGWPSGTETPAISAIKALEFAMLAAYRYGAAGKVEQLDMLWRSIACSGQSEEVYHAYRKARTYMQIADASLASINEKAAVFPLVRSVRLALPHSRGV